MRKIQIPKIKFIKKKQIEEKTTAEKNNETINEDLIDEEKPTRYCMYCGARVYGYGANPEDFLHYSAKDVAWKGSCGFCDGIITQTNRLFYQAVQAKKNNDKELMIQRLKLAVRLLNQAINAYENGDWDINK